MSSSDLTTPRKSSAVQSSPAGTPSGGKAANVQVCCRFRPQNAKEENEGGKVCVEIKGDKSVAMRAKEQNQEFQFDRVFNSDSTQAEVYEQLAKPIVEDVLRGYNGTVFAYGQTASGKTYTMEGPDVEDDDQKGIIPRMVQTIFEGVLNSSENCEFTVKVSYIEIYMERIRDLLDPTKDNLVIHEDTRGRGKGIWVDGATEVYVGDEQEVLEVMKEGANNRAIAETKMNIESSRSHSIFMLTLMQRNLDDLSMKTGKLYLVDLAGSEQVGKTLAEGQQLEEAKNINRSLTTLGRVISALTDGKSSHIPYRDSKLTRVLQESIGGNSRTALVVNCSPSSYNEAETLSTLRFGHRAKNIKNRPKINQERSVHELKQLLARAEKEIERLRDHNTILEEQVRALGGAEGIELTGDKGNLQLVDKCVKFEKELKEAEEKLAALTETNGLLEEKVEALEEDQRVKESAMQSLEKDVHDSMASEDTYAKENELLIHKVADMTYLHEKTQSEAAEKILQLEGDVAARDEEIETLKKSIASLQQSGMADLDSFTKKSGDQTSDAKGVKELMSEWQNEGWVAKENQVRQAYDESMHKIGALESELGQDVALETNDEGDGISSTIEAIGTAIQDTSSNLKKQEGMMKDMMSSMNESDTSALSSDEEDGTNEESVDEESVGRSLVRVGELLQVIASKGGDVHSDIGELQQLVSKSGSDADLVAKMLKVSKIRNEKLRAKVADSKKTAATATEALRTSTQRFQAEVQSLKKQLSEQFNDFEKRKNEMLVILKDRCQKVINLEISLDEKEEQVQQIISSVGQDKSLAKRVAFLERSLDQMTKAHQQVATENCQLRVRAMVAERRVIRRNERLLALDLLLNEAREANERYENVYSEADSPFTPTRYHDRGSPTERATTPTPPPPMLGLSQPQPAGAGSRIAKPIRGGGGVKRIPPSTHKKAGERESWSSSFWGSLRFLKQKDSPRKSSGGSPRGSPSKTEAS